MQNIPKKWNLMLYGLIAIGICIMFYLTGILTLSGDEKFTLDLIQNSYIDIIKLTANDVHPPLYYFILKVIIDVMNVFNLNVIVLSRMISIIPSLILIIIAVKYLKSEFNNLSAVFFSFCIICMPKMIVFSIQIRMYSWSFLFVTCALLHIPRNLRIRSKGTERYSA